MSTDSYHIDEASGNGNEPTEPIGDPYAQGRRAPARARTLLQDSAHEQWSSFRSGAGETYRDGWEALFSGSLWDDHPPSIRRVVQRIHDPAYTGPNHAPLLKIPRYVLGYGIGLPMTLIAYAIAWPFQSESRQIVTLALVAVYLILHIF